RTALPDPEEKELRWYGVEQVRYRVLDEGGSRNLIEVRQPVYGPGRLQPAGSNIVVKGVTVFTIEFFDGTTWSPTWPGDKNEEEEKNPLAAKIRISTSDPDKVDEALSVETVIPAGKIITSTLEQKKAAEEPLVEPEEPGPDSSTTDPPPVPETPLSSDPAASSPTL
ncbi:MAG: hypothetical protein AAF492_13650, partial [Verrucomicrobiota bacterium]